MEIGNAAITEGRDLRTLDQLQQLCTPYAFSVATIQVAREDAMRNRGKGSSLDCDTDENKEFPA